MMKRPFFLLFFTLALLLTGASRAEAATAFSDVDNHWAASYIYQTAEAGLVRGYPDGTFRPEQKISRAEFVTILAMESGETIENNIGAPDFKDIPRNHWAKNYILWGRANNVLSGYEDNTFRPDQTVSRQEMASLLYRYITNYHKKEILTVQQEIIFGDNKLIGDWAREAVKAMQRSGIINGRDNGTFDPLAGATRAETTVMLGKYLSYYRAELNSDAAKADIYFNNSLKVKNAVLQRRNDTLMIPLRNLLESAGYRVFYYPLPGLVVADTVNRDLELWVNNNTYYAGGMKYTFSVAPYSDNGTTLVPLKETAAAAGLSVSLKEEGDTAKLRITGNNSLITLGSNNFYGTADGNANVNGEIFLGSGNNGFYGILSGGKFGYGSYTTANGSFFCGQWSDDTLNGAGRSVTTEGEFYVGTFADGVKNSGVTYYTDGSCFQGTWSKNSSNAVYPAKGKYIDANGITYGNDATEWSYGSLSQSNW